MLVDGKPEQGPELYWLNHCTFHSLQWSDGNFKIIAMKAMNAMKLQKKIFLTSYFFYCIFMHEYFSNYKKLVILKKKFDKNFFLKKVFEWKIKVFFYKNAHFLSKIRGIFQFIGKFFQFSWQPINAMNFPLFIAMNFHCKDFFHCDEFIAC